MDHSEKKMAVLMALKQAEVALSLPEIMSRLGQAYTERTVRRWLAAMVEDGLVEKSGLKRATRYRFIQLTTSAEELSAHPMRFSNFALDILAKISQPAFRMKILPC